MSDLDTLIAAGQTLAAVHDTVDTVIDAGLFYGPGVALTIAAVTTWRAGRWAVARIDQLLRDRADRQEHTARVADRADAYLAMPDALINDQLEAQYAATPDHAPEEGR